MSPRNTQTMKKIIVLILVSFAFFGCGEELEFNTPSFQANKDGNLWEASSYFATVDANGVITVTGTDGLETVTLVAFPQDSFVCTSNDNSVFASEQGNCFDVYTNTNYSFATLTDINNTLWSTNNVPDQSVQIYTGDGEINIREANLETGLISGKFHFTAFNTSGLSSININEGFFYNVPFTTGDTVTYFTCVDAQEATAAALVAFNNVSTLDAAAYELACNNYTSALQVQMDLCGDPNGDIQEILDQLNANNCQITCDQALDNSQVGLNAYVAANMSNYVEMCNNYTQYLTLQIQFCGDTDGSIQATIDSLDCNDDDADGVPNVFEDLNNDGDYTNDDTDGDLNPDYLDEDDDDDLVTTATELVFDVNGNPIDTDGDGIPDYLDEDDDGDGILTINETGDTDSDGIPDYLDSDDDGDGILTIFESPDLDSNGDPSDAIDTDGDMIPNYLDSDDDGDSILTIFENPDPNADGIPNDAQNFDGDTLPDYLDDDDDNDGLLTINENPDPNGDGNPDDAANTDGDSAPDYLDAT